MPAEAPAAVGPGRPPVLRAVPAAPGAGPLAGAEGAEVLAVPVAAGGEEGPQPRSGTADAAAAYGVDLAAACDAVRFTGSAGAVLPVTGAVPRASGPPAGAGGGGGLPPRLVLLGTGDGGAADLRRAGAGLARALRGAASVATTAVALADAEGVRAFAEGFALASWSPPRTGADPVRPAARPAVGSVALLGVAPAALARDPLAHDPLGRAATAARATWRARDLTATPADVATPAWLAARARELADEHPALDVEVLDAAALRARGFGGVIAVGAGSVHEPCLVVARYEPPARAEGARPAPSLHVVLAGKGVTFDTGGLSVKPREAMVAMKTDMAGAAVVLAVVAALAEEGACPHRVTALAPLAENALGGASYRPGDVVTTFGGTTVEVADTDAEGRVLLADVLAMADAELDPDVLVDVATLTGAATQGLGRGHAALYTDDDALAGALAAAGAATGERVWRMPLVEEHLPSLRSQVADLRHVPEGSPGAGSVTAALFLREFTGDRRWAHLDVAGPARAEEERHEVPKGATGFGARLLLRWLEAL